MSAPACPACGRSQAELLARYGIEEQHAQMAPADEGLQRRLTDVAAEVTTAYEMFRCLHCGLDFSSPMRAPSSEWYQLAYEKLDLYPPDRWEYGEVLRHVRSGENLLEIGCGTGAFLEKCRERGLEAAGLDSSDSAVQACRSRRLRAKRLNLADPADPGVCERVSHVAGFHVLEHLGQPEALFQYGNRQGQPGSHLWLSAPSSRRATRCFGQRDYLDEPPHHLTRWNARALGEIGASNGWRLIDVQYEPMTFRVAVWWISVCSPVYRRWKARQRLRNRWVERGFRALLFPYAAVRRLTTLQQLSGHSMLAHFICEG